MPYVINGEVFFTSNLEYNYGSWWHPPKDETTVLAKGLNCVVAPARIPHDEFIVATKLAAVELIRQHTNKDPQTADQLRS